MGMFNAAYAKAIFTPKHPEKCLNTNGKCDKPLPQMRSSWEMKFANFCDIEENVLGWGSEVVEIPYISSLDGKTHRYITDFVLVTKNRDTDQIEKWLIEVKPASQVPKLDEFGKIIFPELNKKKRLTEQRIERWRECCNVLKKNHEKWTAARKWAKDHGYFFKVITEVELDLLNK